MFSIMSTHLPNNTSKFTKVIACWFKSMNAVVVIFCNLTNGLRQNIIFSWQLIIIYENS